jgi:hypothetical protein
MSTLTPELLDALAQRAGRPDFPKLEAQLRSSGYCARPVRLVGYVETCTGDGRRRVWSTRTEPDGILRKACGNRREAVCPPCAERYRQDAYHLISAGLRGGKGVPDTVAEHPALFVTLTAPSFGPVHTRALDPAGEPRRCRPRRDAEVCRHGVRLSCGAVHEDGDACLGEPLCAECFDYAGAVAWNYTVGELWRYTTIYVPRAMARVVGMTQERLKREVRSAYVKVAEYQRRGLVHLHVLARLDRAMPAYRAGELRPPPAGFDGELLERAFRAAVVDVSAPVAPELGGGRVRWGSEVDVRQLRTGAERGEIAGYLAKYATKSTEQAGGLLHRVDPDDVERARVREHVRCYMRAAFELHATAIRRRGHVRPPGAAAVPDVETDWKLPLALRARRAMSQRERVRIRMHDGTIELGRIERIAAGAARDSATVVLVLGGGALMYLADIASIGPAARRVRRRDRREPRLAACAHAFGYRGHCLSKSRRYSTTFSALREARKAFVHAQILARSRDVAQGAFAAAAGKDRIASFSCVGTGHLTAADAYLAAAAAARAREQRQAAREALALGALDHHTTRREATCRPTMPA